MEGQRPLIGPVTPSVHIPPLGLMGLQRSCGRPPSTSINAVRMATREVRRNLAPWVSRDVVTGVSPSIDAYAVVNRRGETTVVWQQNDGGPLPLWSRHLDDSGFGSAIQLTPNGEIAQFNGLVQRPDGKAALLYQRFPLAGDGLETEFRTLTRGVPGPVQVADRRRSDRWHHEWRVSRGRRGEPQHDGLHARRLPRH